MVKTIEKVGVIGAGLMGSSLAALFANVGMETILLDIVPPSGLSDEDKRKGLTEDSREFRNRFATNGLNAALKAKPAAFYVPDAKGLITIGNLEDDLEKLKSVLPAAFVRTLESLGRNEDDLLEELVAKREAHDGGIRQSLAA